ncbi:MAG: TetR family transcriptional regulator [Solirubrobacterales bacterium]|nr:TetR family transcriptional regulator [Solirubrobacterales bacterium]
MSIETLWCSPMGSTETNGGQLERLPRGRHGLAPETIVKSQRSRILTAMVEVTAEHGYARCRIADVIGYAGVSRKTFYELFSDKEDCFLAAYDLWLGRLFSATAHAFDSPTDAAWAERVRSGMAELLDYLAEHPSAARFCIVEVLAAGPKASARRDAGVRQFTHFVDAGRAETSARLPGITAVAIVGGIHELLYSEIIHGATMQLPSRLPGLVFWIVQPFLGLECAAGERDRARAMLAERGSTLGAAS